MKKSTPAVATNPGLSPIRIYVFWHPDMDRSEDPALENRGIRLARRIYHWFRMENMEGMPVYFRSAPEPGKAVPPPVEPDDDVRNYLIALIDANMVASPEWRAYLSDLSSRDHTGMAPGDFSTTGQAADARNKSSKPAEYRFLPVAMESFAYNMPERIRTLNFIRHIPREGRATCDFELLAKITEVLCRDLRHWLHRESPEDGNRRQAAGVGVPGKIKIFLSHAKADDTQEAIAIKEYIQRETQCEAFFDETDIASGYGFGNIIENAIVEESAGLIVLQGDNYSARPWCRKEIRDFLAPLRDPVAGDIGHEQYAVAPVVVVQTMKGIQIARTIPELGYSPSVLWREGKTDAARFVVTTLLREICFGLFYRVLARRVSLREAGQTDGSIYLNRSPDPVMINRIVAKRTAPGSIGEESAKLTFVHPGYGLSKLEQEGLMAAFPSYGFRSFLEASAREKISSLELQGRIIAVSVGNPGDILSRGLWEEHIQEILVRLLRPLLQAQASLLYGGAMPETFRPDKPWDLPTNFTGVLLQLLLGDREANIELAKLPRLYVPVPCHRRHTIHARLIAQWSDVCSFVHIPHEAPDILPEELQAKPPVKPDEESTRHLSEDEKRNQDEWFSKQSKAFNNQRTALEARAYSAMRRKICDKENPLTCELPDPAESGSNRKSIETFIHILIGGKSEGFSGIMPGIFEEALYAFKAKKPVFLIAEYGGASAILAGWLLKPPSSRPPQLNPEHYGYQEMLAGLVSLSTSSPELLHPQAAFDQLWDYIETARSPGGLGKLLGNGLDDENNRKLLSSGSSGEICRLIWEGVATLTIADHGTQAVRQPGAPTAPNSHLANE